MGAIVLAAVFGCLVGAGAVYMLVCNDLGIRRGLLAAGATFIALAVGWVLALYGAVLGAAIAVLAYAVARRRVSTGWALTVAGGAYLVVVAAVATLIFASLSTM